MSVVSYSTRTDAVLADVWYGFFFGGGLKKGSELLGDKGVPLFEEQLLVLF